MEVISIASGSTGNCYRIGDGTTKILIEAGIPVNRIREGCGFRLSDISGCLISHEHGDHASHAKDLTRYGIDVYTSQGTIEGTQGTRYELHGPLVHPVKAMQAFKIRSLTILPFDVEHDAKEPLGFLIWSSVTGEKLLFFTDTFYIKYRFSGLTQIMAECNYTMDQLMQNVRDGTTPAYRIQRLAKSHMSLETLEDMLQANDLSQLKQIYLLHLSSDNSNEEEITRKIQELTGVEVYVC